jgi:peptidyl-prolyl cis-trans isomerase SurA
MKGSGSFDPAPGAADGRPTRAADQPEHTEAVGIDPSLGPNPDVMPPLEDLLPPMASPTAQRPAVPVADSERATQTPGPPGTGEPAPRAAPPAPGPPPAEPSTPPATDPSLEDLPELPPLDLPAGPPASDAGTAGAAAAKPSQAAAPSPLNLAVLPALGALPPQAPAAGPTAPPSAPARPALPVSEAKAPARPAAKADDSHEEAATKSEVQPPALPEFSEIAARVGNETITLRELRYAYRKWAREHLGPHQRLDEEQGYQVLRMILDGLVDRTLLVQEARRLINKNWDKFRDFIDQSWTEEELPGLMRKYAATNEFELRERLKAHGLSYEEMREDYRLTKIAHEFMIMKIRPLLSVDIPEMRDYYNEHLQEFHRPAQVVWREIAVEVAKHRDRGEARRKAEALLDRLRHGADFIGVAKAESEGPTADRGGLWATTPGSYAVPAVNAALDTLPLQQVSGVIEGPDSFHIIRVENRRAAGPARFDEVQDQIRETLFDQKYDKELKALLEKLRGRTLISTQLDEH